MNRNSSIDTTEIEKFNKTSQEWWDEEGEFKILHQINPLRLEYILSKMKKHFFQAAALGNASLEEKNYSNIEILDVGCGGGLISSALYRLGFNVTGLDANQYNQKAASDYAKQNNLNINFIHSTIEEYAESGKNYDVILCLEVLEHVANMELFLQKLDILLKKDGLLILSTINRTIKSYLLAIVMAEYILRWIPAGTHNYSKFLKPSEIIRLFGDLPIKLEELMGLQFAPLSNKWYLSEDIDVNYFMVLKKIKRDN